MTPEIKRLIKEARTFYHNHDRGQEQCFRCIADAAHRSLIKNSPLQVAK